MITRRTLLLVLAFGAAVRVAALMESHSPFPPGTRPAPIPIEIYRAPNLPFKGTFKFTRADGLPSPLTITDGKDGFRLTVDAGTISSPSINVPGAMVAGVSACEVDLNGDGRPDYFVITHSGGCGLAGQVSWVTFILSSASGYRAHVLAAYDASFDDLVDINRNGRPEFIHEFFVSGVPGKDGIAHNYWVFNLIGFGAEGLITANGSAPDFPRWIWFSARPNHQVNDQLNPLQKTQSWAQATSVKEDRWFRSDLSFLRQLIR